jgi:hypothetical protein
MRTAVHTSNSFSGGPICGRVQTHDYSGNIVWDFTYSTTNYCTHHDMCPMPNGNVLLIAYERKTAAEVTAAGCSAFASEMWPDKIVEVQPTGATTGIVVWEWHAWDHLMQNTNAAAANYVSNLSQNPQLLNINYKATKDWLHMNGVNYNPYLDQITWSSHNMYEVYVIDHSTTTAEAASHSGGNSGKGGDILYRWGNPVAYGASGTQILKVVHDAHWIPEGSPNAGRLVGFNNQGVSTTLSCVDQVEHTRTDYTYPVTSGQAYLPASYTSRQANIGYGSNMGNSQQLPNGNQLITVATAGNIFEFDAAGNQLWTFHSTGSIPKSFRYNDCYINNTAPGIPTIADNAGTLTSSVAVTYQWYMNGNLIGGATSQDYTPTQNGIYVVRITDANGCVYRYSAGYHVTTITGISDASTALSTTFSVSPNPSTGIFNINYKNQNAEDMNVRVSDLLGNIILVGKNLPQVDLSKSSNGIYFISITTPSGGTLTRKISLVH